MGAKKFGPSLRVASSNTRCYAEGVVFGRRLPIQCIVGLEKTGLRRERTVSIGFARRCAAVRTVSIRLRGLYIFRYIRCQPQVTVAGTQLTHCRGTQLKRPARRFTPTEASRRFTPTEGSGRFIHFYCEVAGPVREQGGECE